MKRTFVTSALAGAFVLGLATAAFAVTGEFNNMCTEGLVSNEQAKAEFLKNPDANLAKAQAFYSKSHQG